MLLPYPAAYAVPPNANRIVQLARKHGFGSMANFQNVKLCTCLSNPLYVHLALQRMEMNLGSAMNHQSACHRLTDHECKSLQFVSIIWSGIVLGLWVTSIQTGNALFIGRYANKYRLLNRMVVEIITQSVLVHTGPNICTPPIPALPGVIELPVWTAPSDW